MIAKTIIAKIFRNFAGTIDGFSSRITEKRIRKREGTRAGNIFRLARSWPWVSSTNARWKPHTGQGIPKNTCELQGNRK